METNKVSELIKKIQDYYLVFDHGGFIAQKMSNQDRTFEVSNHKIIGEKFYIGMYNPQNKESIPEFVRNKLKYEINDIKNLETSIKKLEDKHKNNWKKGILITLEPKIISDKQTNYNRKLVYGTLCLYQNGNKESSNKTTKSILDKNKHRPSKAYKHN